MQQQNIKLQALFKSVRWFGRVGKQQVNLNTVLLGLLAFFARRYVDQMDERDTVNAAAIQAVAVVTQTNAITLAHTVEQVKTLEWRADRTDERVSGLSQRLYIVEQKIKP